MKSKFLILAGVVCFILSTQVEAAEGTLAILKSRSTQELGEKSHISGEESRDDRACEIQRQQGIPPSLCYRAALKGKNAAREIRELDEECRSLSRSATSVPAINAYTSETCRRALSLRTEDLLYAGIRARGARDALR